MIQYMICTTQRWVRDYLFVLYVVHILLPHNAKEDSRGTHDEFLGPHQKLIVVAEKKDPRVTALQPLWCQVASR